MSGIYQTIKTMVIALTTTPTGAIALPVPTGSVDLKGCYFRAWTDAGQAILKLGNNTVAADKTITSNSLADGNIPATLNFENTQPLPAGATHISAVAMSGTPNLFVEIGLPVGD